MEAKAKGRKLNSIEHAISGAIRLVLSFFQTNSIVEIVPRRLVCNRQQLISPLIRECDGMLRAYSALSHMS